MDCAAWRSVRKGFLENFKTLVNLLFTFASDGLLVLGYVFFFFFASGVRGLVFKSVTSPLAALKPLFFDERLFVLLFLAQFQALLGTCCLSISTSRTSTWSITCGLCWVKPLAQPVRVLCPNAEIAQLGER